MRRRHLRGVMAIERQVYPRPWSPNLFVAEMSESRNRCYLVARSTAPSSGTRADLLRRRGARHERRRRSGCSSVTDRDAAITDLMLGAVEMGAEAVSLEVRVSKAGAHDLYGGFGFRSSACETTHQEIKEDASHHVADGVRTAVYAARALSASPRATQRRRARDERSRMLTHERPGNRQACDDTAVAVVEDEVHGPLGNLIATQVDLHERFGAGLPRSQPART